MNLYVLSPRTVGRLCASLVALTILAGFTLTSAADSPKVAPATQKTEAAAPSPLPRGPVLTGEDGQPIKGVKLARAEVRATIDGPLAEATMLLTFANDQPQVLGGELVFPLPEGTTVTGYGLDVNGVMVDGVAVEKQRARIIYEKELHKRVDPGLVEHVAGNAFRTRLYPVPANGTRTVKIQYLPQVELGGELADKPGKASVTLPVGWADVVDKVDVRVEVRNAAAAPVIAGLAGDQPGLKVEKDDKGGGFIVSGEVPTAALRDGQGGLTVILPALPDRSVSVQKRLKVAASVEDVEEQMKGGDAAKRFDRFEHFFVVSDTPAPAIRKAAPLKDGRVGIVWDASLSRADTDHGRELKVLAALLDKLGNPPADVIVVRNSVEVRPFFAAGNEGSAAAIDYLKGLAYDGATNLGAVTFTRNAPRSGVPGSLPAAPYNLFLLFTDGMGNLGAQAPARAEAPVCAIADDDRVNYPVLTAVCRQSGGAFFNLRSATDEQVLAGVGDAPFSFVSADFDPKEVAEIYPGPGAFIHGRFTLAGKLLAPEAKVTVNYGYGKEITHSETFTIRSADAATGTLLPRVWAQQKVADLSLLPEKNAGELEQVGKEFNLVTPNTSLLVLETADQYVQYRVVPPKERTDVYKEFLARIEQNKAAEQQTREQKIQQVAALWQQRVAWWEKEYKYPKDLKVQPPEEGKVLARWTNLSADLGATAPPAPAGDARPAISPAAPAPSPEPAISRAVAPSEPAAAATPGPRPALPGEHEATITVPPSRVTVRGTTVQAGPGGSTGVIPDRRLAVPEAPPADVQDLVPDFRDAPNFNLQAGHPDAGRDSAEQRGFRGLFGGDSEKDGDGNAGSGASIAIKPWDPATPYLAEMAAAGADRAYSTFLDQRRAFGRSPAFYLDCADFFVKSGHRDFGVRVLTDVAELQLEDARLLRVAAHRLMQIGERETAIDLFEKVLALRPEEPQSYRDLALALADRADATVANARGAQAATDRAVADYTRSLELLNKVVLGEWERFPEIELPVLMEANAIAARAAALPGVHDFHNPIDTRLQKLLDLDVRVVLTWDADQTDIDLWVTEPSGEKCFYEHNRTVIGGLLSRDYTDGYGPEEYCLRKLMPGKYTIQANYYGSRQQELTGPATVQATVITDFGRPTEKRQALTVRLKDVAQVVDIGTITLGAGEAKVGPATRPAELNK